MGAVFAVARSVLEIFLSEISVFIQRFTALQEDPMTFLCGQFQFEEARQILSKIYHSLTIRCGQECTFKPFRFHNGNRIVVAQQAVILRKDFHSMPSGDLFHPGIVNLTLLQIILPNGTLLTGLPSLICCTDDFIVRHKLADKSNPAAV